MTETAADIILYNGTIHTLDPRQPSARAIAVKGKKILDVGEDKQILTHQAAHTRMIDLDNRLVLPGFIDTHFHFYEWALNYDSIDFSRTPSFSRMQKQIAKKAERLGNGCWVLGQGFNDSDWPEKKLPDRLDLDKAAKDSPVCIWRCDLHLAVANSLALKLAGIQKQTPDPCDGVIVKDAAGNPTGVLKELAPNLIRSVIPKLDQETVLNNMQKAMADANELGLTSIHDIRLMGGEDGKDAMNAWQVLHQQNKLSLRCHVGLPGEKTEEAVALGLMTGFGDDLLKTGHLKFFSDGGMGARTAWLLEPYLDAGSGMPLTDVAQIEAAVTLADQNGLSAMVHAIGDRANREIIRMFRRIEKRFVSRCRIPHRIEHLQMVRPKELTELSKLTRVVATCQPNNMSLDISMIQECVGERSRFAYPLKSILETGIPVMIGSDAPVADKNPLAGIYSAVARRRMDFTPEQGWHMEQALTIEEAVQGYTKIPALASGAGECIGTLSSGKFADIVVLGQNIYTADLQTVPDIKIDITLFNGDIVHDRG